MKRRTNVIPILNFLLILFVLFLSFLIKICFTGIKPDIVIMGAMESEVNNLIFASNSHQKQSGCYKIAKGRIGKNKVLIVYSGIGKVNSAIATQYMIDKYHPKLIINTGIAGAVDEKLKIGDVVIASGLVQYDADLTYFGYEKGYIPNFSHKKSKFFETNEKLNNIFKEKIANKYLDLNVTIGEIATGDKFVSDYNVKMKINKTFNAEAVDMESASIAQTAQVNKIPCVVIRTISDLAYDVRKDEKFSNYQNTEIDIAAKSADILIHVLRNVDLKKVL